MIATRACASERRLDVVARSRRALPGRGQHLHRYARVLGCAEINSSFHRPHRPAVYERWAASTPPLPLRGQTAADHHARRRRGPRAAARFLDEVAGPATGLAVRLGSCPLVRVRARPCARGLPPARRRLRWRRRLRRATPAGSAGRRPGARALRSGRVAADPARSPRRPGPEAGSAPTETDAARFALPPLARRTARLLVALRTAWLQDRANELVAWSPDAERWCVFDNTASGEAISNAARAPRSARWLGGGCATRGGQFDGGALPRVAEAQRRLTTHGALLVLEIGGGSRPNVSTEQRMPLTARRTMYLPSVP